MGRWDEAYAAMREAMDLTNEADDCTYRAGDWWGADRQELRLGSCRRAPHDRGHQPNPQDEGSQRDCGDLGLHRCLCPTLSRTATKWRGSGVRAKASTKHQSSFGTCALWPVPGSVEAS